MAKKDAILLQDKSGEITLKEEITETGLVPYGTVDEGKKKKPKKSKKTDSEKDGGIFDDFPDLAALMNVSVQELKEEFFLFQIRKLMGKMGKVIVRHSLTDKQVEKIFLNSATLKMGEILVSPVYIPTCARQVQKNDLHSLPVCTLIDFPFGESSLKSKIADIKDSVNSGVDGVTVVIPSVLTTPDYARDFKKQAKKIAKGYPNCAGIALNATDLTDEQIKRAVKTVEKTNLNSITFMFGETALPELKEKMAFINTVKGDKKIKVLANVDSAEAVMALFKLDVDTILTPYADEIGEALIKRFNIKSVNLR